MFERFTERARQVVVTAQEESRALGHGYIGTEHILLALLRDEDGIAVYALAEQGMTVEEVRSRVEQSAVRGPGAPAQAIPFTPLAKKVLERALRQALALGHKDIGTEHILLGLLDVGDGSGATILRELGLDAATVRVHVSAMHSTGPRRGTTSAPGARSRTVTAPMIAPDVRAFLAEIEREIREQLEREPDVLDYWLALASVPGSLAEEVLRELGADAAALAQAIDRARSHGAPPLGALTPDQAARHA